MNNSFCILYGHIVITFGKENTIGGGLYSMSIFQFIYFLFILGLQIIIIHIFLIIHIKFKGQWTCSLLVPKSFTRGATVP